MQDIRIRELPEFLKLKEVVVKLSREPMPMSCISEVRNLNVSMRMSEFDEGPLSCEMPLSRSSTYCDACVNLGPVMNCKKHMRICQANDVFLGCPNCSRVLCPKHLDCYCFQAVVAILQNGKNTSPGQCTSRGRSNGTNPSPGS